MTYRQELLEAFVARGGTEKEFAFLDMLAKFGAWSPSVGWIPPEVANTLGKSLVEKGYAEAVQDGDKDQTWDEYHITDYGKDAVGNPESYDGSNGLETLEYVERIIPKKLTPQDIVAATEGRAELLARCILGGLVEPEGPMNPHIMLTVAHELLRHKPDEKAFMALEKYQRAFAWATREDVAPEYGIFFGQQAMAGLSRSFRRNLAKTPEYKLYAKKYGPVLESLKW